MQRSRYTHTAKQVFPYSQESTTGSLHKCTTNHTHLPTISVESYLLTWTFDRLAPDGNEGVGVQMDYLECAYETKYYVIDKVNGQINVIHNDSLELTEFEGQFSPFDLDELEMKVCRLADRNNYEDDLPEPQDALQA